LKRNRCRAKARKERKRERERERERSREKSNDNNYRENGISRWATTAALRGGGDGPRWGGREGRRIIQPDAIPGCIGRSERKRKNRERERERERERGRGMTGDSGK